mmetsp:Transcript_26883/g.81618  ORF Transcript_26883/g.81618 Transcript_26883/m.81618 type:complete len:288 (-) Transcript_26883:18-881(-)
MLDQGKRHRVRPTPASLLPGDRNARLCAMAAEAREKLRHWSSQEKTNTFDSLYDGVGAHEGCGGLLRIAALDPTGSGHLTEAEADRFLWESSQLFEELIHFLNLAALVAALAFTVAVPLAVLNLDGLSTFDAIDPSLGGAQSLGWYKRWRGPRLLHAMHWTGNGLIALSVYASFKAIALCFVMIPSYSFYLPDVESRLRFFMQDHKEIQYVWAYTYGSVALLLLSLPFLAARISPVASTCALIPAASAFSVFRALLFRADHMANFQLDIARRLMADGGEIFRGEVVS